MADIEQGLEQQQQRGLQQHPNLHLSPEERRLFGQLFNAADTDKLGVVTGETAVKFFEKTRLSQDTLGEIWQIADVENRGLLTPAGFGIVLRLIGYAQAGRPVSLELAVKPGGPLPKFDGITAPIGTSAPPPPQAQPLQAQTSGGPIRVPPLTPDKVAQYSSLFDESGAQNGKLSGETAKQIFERAQLPNDVLGRIWNLADREQKGHLGLTEFIIAMHLLASFKNGSMRALPQLLPAGLYEAAARRGIPRQLTGTRPASGGTSVPKQFDGSGYLKQASPVTRTQQLPFQQPMSTGDQWAITPQEKAQFDQIFATVDTQNRGFITGEQAVGFFSNSRLAEDALAQIWDLADINSEGQLNRDEFAVAMYLIKQQRSKRDGRDILPSSLPTNLIPPSMRRQPIAPQQPTAPAFDNAANITSPKSASEDLFGLDAISTPPSTAPIQPKATGDSSYASTPPRTQYSSPPPQSQQQPSHFKPFVPSSSFGQSMLTPQGTGTSSTASPVVQHRSVPQQQAQTSAMDDLLGDNDPEVSKRLTSETTELANLSTQVSSLTGQMQEIKSKRGITEQSINQAQSQKRDFESRLSQLRAAYQQEVKEVQSLESQLTALRNETRQLQQDMAMVQGTHQDLQNQHRQIGEALSVDQNENATLKEKIRQTNAEIAEIKPQLEKARSDARQQKGLVAINKKQLATNEIELEKIKAELEAAAKEHEDARRDLEQSQHDLENTAQTISQARNQLADVATPAAAVVSPVPSTTSMNPFFRRASNAAQTDRGFASPLSQAGVASPNHDAFDSFFGPSLGSSSHIPDAPTSSKTETTSNAGEPFQHTATFQEPSTMPNLPTSRTPPSPSIQSDSPQTAYEPPAPPQSRQITSSFLPLRPNMNRSSSGSSSIRANPPASRMGDRALSGFETPDERQMSIGETPISDSPRQHFEEVVNKAAHPGNSQATPPSSQPTSSTSAEGNNYHEDPVAQSPGLSSASRDLPGAFPGDETPMETPQPRFFESAVGPYSDSQLDPRVDSTPRPQASAVTLETPTNHDDPFAVDSNEAHNTVATKDDFDSAFAGFVDKGKAPEYTNGNAFGAPEAPKSQTEFPPIQEFAADDESDSDEDRAFDDNFATHPANRTAESGPNQALQEPLKSAESGLAAVRPPFDTRSSNASQLPTPGAQASPPAYDQTIGSSNGGGGLRKGSNQFPAEYSGLLPSRDDPTSSTTSPTPSNLPSNVATTTGIDRSLNFFGNDTPEHAAGHAPSASGFGQEHSPMSPGASSNAAYAYSNNPPPTLQTQGQTSAATKTTAHDDFDDEFADLAEAQEDKGDEDFGSSRRTDFDEFNPTFDSPAMSRHTAQSTASTFPPSDTFADFESSITGAGSASRQGVVQETPSHDWDAIFAGLDTPQNNGVQPGPLSKEEFPGSEQQHQESQQNLGQASKDSQLRRATTAEESEQDDPILKRLTGMGYPRNESLQALEKYDYNLDKAADYLTSKS